MIYDGGAMSSTTSSPTRSMRGRFPRDRRDLEFALDAQPQRVRRSLYRGRSRAAGQPPVLVAAGSYGLVQDGSADTLGIFRSGRPGPLSAIRDFLSRHPEFGLDRARCERFSITHHPDGWLRRRRRA
jgi:hypothetical protein